METSSADMGRQAESPTLPLPPPQGKQIQIEDFIESATRAVLRALASELNPQPLPPHPEAAVAGPHLNPQPIPPGRRPDIIIGIIYRPDLGEVAAAGGPQQV